MTTPDRNSPPRWFTRFLHWFCKSEYYEDIQGDLEEEYMLLCQEDMPSWKANNWYRWQIIRLFRPSIMKETKVQQLINNQTIMFRNHLKIGFRNLWKYKTGTAINISGLALGMAAFILIVLFLKDELSYDKHHEYKDEIYRVTVKNYTREGALSRHWAYASAGHAQRLKEDYSHVTHAGRFYTGAFPDLTYNDKIFPAEDVTFADKEVFDIFTFNFLDGSKENVFEDLFSLVLTESSAIKIFGNDWKKLGIIGETVKVSRPEGEGSFKVTGVIADMPDQQHFHFEYLAPIRFLEPIMGEEEMNNVGGNYNWLTYIRIAPGTDIPSFEIESNDFFEKYMGKFGDRSAGEFYDFVFQPLTDIHLHSNLEGEVEANGDIQQIYIFGVVGILLLVVAMANYMNLATSHYSRRMKEVGVRKSIGANKASLIQQFLTESVIVTLIAAPASIILVTLGLPYVNDFMEKSLAFDLINQLSLLAIVFGLAIMIGIIAGAYPAVFLSRIHLLRSLKGESAVRSSKWNFRSWLVTFQYAVSIALIFVIMVIEDQMSFIQNSDPGYQKEQILNLGLSRNIRNVDVFKQELQKLPNVEKVALSSRIPTGRLLDNWGSSFYRGDSLVSNSFRLPVITVDENFLDAYDIDMIAGKPFRKDQDALRDSIGYYIINEAAARALGFLNPGDIVGSRMGYGPFNGDQMKIGKIQGVVADFHFESMHSPIVPIVMIKTNHNGRQLSLRLKGTNYQNTISEIEEVHRKFDPEMMPIHRFVDELFDEQYQQEERLGTMIQVFTAIAIFIACLGLIGMVGFIIETKTKEIGIRKVLGASVHSILLMISSQFFILIGIAFIIALPISYYFMNDWLMDFEYRTGITIPIILWPLVVAGGFTLFTVAYQSLKASMANPVESLKDE